MNESNPAKSVIVTGAVGDIGRAICKKFTETGHYIIGLDVKNEPHQYINHFIECDLDKLVFDNKVQENFHSTVYEINNKQPLYTLINNAAVQILGNLEDIDTNSIHKSLNINVVAPLILSKLFYRYLEQTKGCIINIGSIHANLTKPGFINYATSKSALAGMTRSMAIELAELGIRVNCIEPAAIETKMLKDGFKKYPECMQRLNDVHPLKRIGKPEEVAELASYLASKEAGFITGASIRIDGGIGSRLYDPI